MNAYVVVEGRLDARLLTNLLPHEIQEQTAIVVCGERSNITSVARTLLVSKRKPLVLLANANTVDESSILAQRQMKEELLRFVSGGAPFKVFMLVPVIEVLLFRVPTAIERITGQQFSAETRVLIQYDPKRVIQQMGHDKNVGVEQIIDGLTPDEWNVIQETSPIKELLEFLSEKLIPKQELQPV